MSTETQYAYSVARIRTLEKKMLDKSKIDRMVDSKTPEEAFKVLLDSDFGSAGSDSMGTGDYEKLLSEEQDKVYALLKEIAPEPEVFNLFLVGSDYHNAKVILKSEFLGQENDTLLVETGTIAPAKLKVMVKDRNYKDMSVIMKEAIIETLDHFNRLRDPQIIDLIMDRASFKQMKEIADSFKNGFLIELVQILIDMANIKSFLRIKKMGKQWDLLNKVLLEGGRIEPKFYLQKADEALEAFAECMKFSAYDKLCEEGIGNFLKTGSLTRYEKLSDNYIMSFIKKARYIALGVEPLVAYLLAKETEIKNARIIMVGKINNISNDIIRERLREAYV